LKTFRTEMPSSATTQQLINVPDAVYCRGAEWYPTVQYSKEKRKLPTDDAS
jgi:hypothetical protein